MPAAAEQSALSSSLSIWVGTMSELFSALHVSPQTSPGKHLDLTCRGEIISFWERKEKKKRRRKKEKRNRGGRFSGRKLQDIYMLSRTYSEF